MKDNYRKIEFAAGQSIESAVKELKEHAELVCGDFNGQILYSDVDDIDSSFKKVTGKTKAEFDEAQKKISEKYEREEKEHKEAIPELTKEWIKKGSKILDDKHLKLWSEIVPIRLGDLYKGFELGASLDIIEKLNTNCELDIAKNIIEGQGHSGMSFGLVCSMVKALCDRGSEFVKYVK